MRERLATENGLPFSRNLQRRDHSREIELGDEYMEPHFTDCALCLASSDLAENMGDAA